MFNIIEHMSLRELQSIINTPELGADDLMKCALGVKTAEVEAYCALSGLGKTTVQEVADRLDKSRPTTQRLLQSLVEKGLATREEELIGLGGYKFVYAAVPPERLKASIRGMLDKWYSKMVKELDDLPTKIEEMGCPRRFSR
ncbi:TPA: helix-turn-helix domain-containing protein [Candidatus Bathyarchaeota archaeon]|nr:helix-turn-helix domain-containing protein [Candidatus Bathyarchaeota archaeon]